MYTQMYSILFLIIFFRFNVLLILLLFLLLLLAIRKLYIMCSLLLLLLHNGGHIQILKSISDIYYLFDSSHLGSILHLQWQVVFVSCDSRHRMSLLCNRRIPHGVARSLTGTLWTCNMRYTAIIFSNECCSSPVTTAMCLLRASLTLTHSMISNNLWKHTDK